MLEKTLESPLDCKEIQPVHPKGDQSWVFIGRIDVDLSMGFSRQEYWSGLPFPSPGDLPNQGIEPGSPTLEADALTSEPLGKPLYTIYIIYIYSIYYIYYNAYIVYIIMYMMRTNVVEILDFGTSSKLYLFSKKI